MAALIKWFVMSEGLAWHEQSVDIIALIHKLPALGQCRIYLAWCVRGGEDMDIPSVVKHSDVILGIPLVQTTCMAEADNEKQPSPRSGHDPSPCNATRWVYH